MQSNSPSSTSLPSPRHLTRINFYKPSCWVGNTIQRIADTALTHCTVQELEEGPVFHVSEKKSQWRSSRVLHHWLAPYVQLRLYTPRAVNAELATPLMEPLRFDATELAAWAINRRKGHVTDQPDSCVEAVRRWLLVGGLETRQGTPDELYFQLIQEHAAVPTHF